MADHSSLPSVNNVKARFEQMAAAAEAVELPPKRVSYSVTMPVSVDINVRDVDLRSKSVPSIKPVSTGVTAGTSTHKKHPPNAPPKPARLSQHGRSQSTQVAEKVVVTASTYAYNSSTTIAGSEETYFSSSSSSLMPPPQPSRRDRSITPPVIHHPARIKTPVNDSSKSPIRTPPTPPLPRSRTPVDPKSVNGLGLGLRSPQPITPSNPPTLPPRPLSVHRNTSTEALDQYTESVNLQQHQQLNQNQNQLPHPHPHPSYTPHHLHHVHNPHTHTHKPHPNRLHEPYQLNNDLQTSSYPNLPLQQALLSPPVLPPRPVRSVSPHDRSKSPAEAVTAGVQPYPPQPLPSENSDSENDTLYSLSNTSNPTLASTTSEYTYYGCPDSSQASRRPPIFEGILHSIQSSKSEPKKTVSSFGKYACVSSGSSTTIYNTQTGEQLWSLSHSDTRISSIGYKSDDGRILLLGTKDGQIWEVDLTNSAAGNTGITNKRSNTHLTPIVLIHRNEETNEAWTLSEDGKLCVWTNCDISTTPKTFRVTPNFKAFGVAGSTLWIGRNRQIFVYQPSSLANVPLLLTARPIVPASLPPPPPTQQLQPSPSSASISSMNGYTNGSATTTSNNSLIGEFTAAANLSNISDRVYFGHDNGCISIYSVSQLAFIETINVSMYKVCSMCGVGNYLWIGLKTGTIIVCDVSTTPWTIRKEWKAHDSAVVSIECFDDLDMSQIDGLLPVISCSLGEGTVALWDGLLKHDWIELDLQNHDNEFSTPRDVKVQVITWNAGASKPGDLTVDDQNNIMESIRKEGPEIIVFGFQELVELDNKSVTAKSMFHSKRKKEKEVAVVISSHISHQYKAWQERLDQFVTSSLSDRYRLIHSNNMVGLFTCVFMKETSCSRLRDVKSSYVKTGLGGLHGNKGGLAVRMVVDDSSLCFVNCHLAAGQSGVLQRNSDIETILETKFSDESDNTNFTSKGIFVNGGDGTMIMDHEICFFSGDMNYRINKHRQIAIKHIQENSLDQLLEHDQLGLQLKKNPGLRLRAFNEHQITFPPTYKFDVGTDRYDSSEKKRVPAWCDRIFYRGGIKVLPLVYESLSVRSSDHRPVVGVYKVQLKTIDASKRKDVYKDSLLRWKSHLEIS